MSSTTSIASVCNEDNKCANCCTQLLGPHCYACGQPVKGMVRHFSSVIGDFLDTLLAFDSRTWKTIPALLFRPGFLTTEYFSGRRVRYVSPVRLFIFLCITSLFVTRLSGDWTINFMDADASNEGPQLEASGVDLLLQADRPVHTKIPEQKGLLGEIKKAEISLIEAKEEVEEGIKRGIKNEVVKGSDKGRIISQEDSEPVWQSSANDPDNKLIRMDIKGLPKPMQDWMDAKTENANQNIKQVTENPNRFKKVFLKTIPYTLLIMLPVFAMMLWVFYIFKRRLYMEHLTVALHSHAFIFLSILIGNILYMLSVNMAGYTAITLVLETLITLLVFWVLVYLLWMQKRIYRQGWFVTFCKYSVLGMAYLCLLSIGAVFTIVWSLAGL
ncbi:DUF3667 domain-containing protein [Microbulbifer sp. JTAC008]|uniref:DUF3667 domain-containing protein n=1 Tax=unclassified Microbulbifer TaxID=2619833 RepID=UPI004039957D